MASSTYPMIAREAWPMLGLGILLGLLFYHFVHPFAAVPVWSLVAVLAFLFRDPAREVPSSPLAVLAPVDGRIVAIETVENPHLKRAGRRITLRMYGYGIYGIRSPMEGKVQEGGYEAQLPGIGPRIFHWIQSDERDDVVISIRKRGALMSPRCYVHAGERVGQGQRCGLIPFGAFVDVFVPESARVLLAVGARVRGGQDVLAQLVHP